jgi:elongator complex protein 3
MRAQEEGRDVSLNAVRAQVAKKNKLSKSPRLVDIIAAVPEGPMKEKLLPKLKAKPIRTASGVSYPFFCLLSGRCGRLNSFGGDRSQLWQ